MVHAEKSYKKPSKIVKDSAQAEEELLVRITLLEASIITEGDCIAHLKKGRTDENTDSEDNFAEVQEAHKALK